MNDRVGAAAPHPVAVASISEKEVPLAERTKELRAPQAALAESPLLARLDDAERARLVASLELREFPAKTRSHGDGDAG